MAYLDMLEPKLPGYNYVISIRRHRFRCVRFRHRDFGSRLMRERRHAVIQRMCEENSSLRLGAGLIRATRLSEGPQLATSSLLFGRPERSTQIL